MEFDKSLNILVYKLYTYASLGFYLTTYCIYKGPSSTYIIACDAEINNIFAF